MLSILVSILVIAYVLLVLVLWLGWERAQPFEDISDFKNPVSVIIAARNESQNILKILGDIENQNIPLELMEVVIVDDHSTDNTVEIIEDYLIKTSLSCQLLTLDNEEGKKAAIYMAIENANNELIIATDADCRVGPDWVFNMASWFKLPEIQLVAGPVRIFPQNSFFERLQAYEFTTLIASGAATITLGWPTMANGANLAYRKSAYNLVQERQEYPASGDDVFLMHKIKERFPDGVRFCKDDKATVDTPGASSVRSFYHQRKRWASKWSAYQHWPTRFLAVAIFIINLAILSLPVLILLNQVTWVLAANLFIIKFVFEFWFIKTIQRFFNSRFHFYEFIILTIIYPFYVTFMAIAGSIGKYEWKGRQTV